MGRGKLRFELIRNEKSRKLTFKKRKEGLIKKLHELTTLCDVSACMIISEAAPSANNHQEQPAVDHIWPPDPAKVRRIIESYEAKKNHSSSSSCSKVITFGLSDFFRHRRKKIEEELAELRRKSKYPICHELLNSLTEAQLREFGAALENKAQIVKSRIEFLKMTISTKQQLESSVDFAAMKNWNLGDQETASSPSSSMMMMMDFAPERLGFNQPHEFDDANWNIINEHEIADSSLMVVDFAPETFGLVDSNSFQSLNVEQQIASSSSLSAVDHDHEQIYSMMNENFDEFEFAYSSFNGNNFQQCYWENLEEDVFQYNDSLWS